MKKDTRVIWSSKKLAREYNLNATVVSKLLIAIGAKRWSDGKYYYDLDS